MSDRPMPKIGQIYRHWQRGQAYRVCKVEKCFGSMGDASVKSEIFQGETVVFYESCRTKTIYARSLSNFLEVLSSGTGDNVSNWHRFELVKNSEATGQESANPV